MNIPDKMFATYGWTEICVYMYVKRNLSDGTLGVSYQRVADEFGITKGKARHMIARMISAGLIREGIRSAAAPSISSRTAQKKPTSGKTTEERMKEFYQSLIPYVKTYGKKTVREFYDYWSEPNPSGRKMRYELQKTWDLHRRLERWGRNNEMTPQKGMHADGTILHAGQMDYEKDGW